MPKLEVLMKTIAPFKNHLLDVVERDVAVVVVGLFILFAMMAVALDLFLLMR